MSTLAENLRKMADLFEQLAEVQEGIDKLSKLLGTQLNARPHACDSCGATYAACTRGIHRGSRSRPCCDECYETDQHGLGEAGLL